MDHLEELRGRLASTLVALTLLTGVGYFLAERVVELLSAQAGGLVFLRPAEAFLVRLKIALILGTFMCVPVLLYEAWRFVGVALTPSEKRLALGVIPASVTLFLLGACCAWFTALPAASRFLLGFAAPGLSAQISIDAYLSFAAWLTAAFGLVFQLPLIVLFVVKAGLATPRDLADYRRHVILGLAIMAAAMTPGPDLFSQLALLLPAWMLYEISILLARWLIKPEGRPYESGRPSVRPLPTEL